MKNGPGRRDKREILADLFTATGITSGASLVGKPPTQSPAEVKADLKRAAKGQAPTDALANPAADFDLFGDEEGKPKKVLYTRGYQVDAENAVFLEWEDNRATLVVMATGTGKCLGFGTPVLMFDGSIRPVERIVIGDCVMGPDSRPRRVVSLAHGREPMYRITPNRGGESYTCNESHILSLKWTNEGRERSCRVAGEIVNVSVREYLSWGPTARHVAKAWRAPVTFPSRVVPLDPYFVGLWLGDGASRYPGVTTTDPEIVAYLETVADQFGLTVRREDSNGTRCPTYSLVGSRGYENPITACLRSLGLIQNKHVPPAYRSNTAAVRLDVLAGLIDTDGSYDGTCYTIIQSSRRLAEDAAYLARSLGFCASLKATRKVCTNSATRAEGEYHLVTISGELNRIPVRLPRKKAAPRAAKTNPLLTGFKVEAIGEDDYYGFELEGSDRLFMLGDFTVTHNTVVATRVGTRVLANELKLPSHRLLFLAHREELIGQAFDTFREAFPNKRVEIERATDRASRHADIVIGSNQTMGRKDRFELYPRDFFAAIVQDEAHHAAASNATYNAPLKWFHVAKVLGLTATPDRKDELALGQTFDSVAFTFDIVDGVREGYLVPVGQRLEIVKDIDYSTVKLDGEGEFNEDDLARVMREDKPLYALADAAIKYSNYNGGQRRTLVFCASREHAIDVADILNEKHRRSGTTGRAAAIHYKLDKERRSQLIAAYKRGEIRYLTNFGILCLDDQTEILTERGWVGIDGMLPTDRVANYIHEGDRAGEIYFAEPKAIVRRDRLPGERMVSVDGRRGNIRVTADHRMLFRKPRRAADPFAILHAANCVNLEGDVPVSGHARAVPFVPSEPAPLAVRDRARLISANAYHLRQSGMSPAEAVAEAERRLDTRRAMRFASSDALTLDDCRLIGFYLAEGTRAKIGGGVEYQINQSVKNPHVVAWFDGVVSRTGVYHRRTEADGVVRWAFNRGTGAGSPVGLYRLEPWLDKDGTPLFWSLDRDQWRALIEGFWFGDGDHEQRTEQPRRFRLFNTSKPLIDWMQAVTTCRGGRATIGRATGNDDNGYKPLYKLSVAWDVDARGMSEQRLQFESYWTPERVWCVTSHTGNIVTRRGGVVTITGNTEGFDSDETRVIVNGRPIHKNRALFAQMVGRATRPLFEIQELLAKAPDAAARKAIIKASRKPGAMVVDLCGINHKLVLNMTDLLGGHYTEEAVAAVRERIAKSTEVVDVEDELAKIQRKIDEQKAEERRKRLRESVNLEVTLTGKSVDPFNVYDKVSNRGVGARTDNRSKKGQIDALERYGVPRREAEEMSNGEARKMLDILAQRKRQGLCTYRQANKLAEFGYSTDARTFAEAKAILDALAANGWQPIDYRD